MIDNAMLFGVGLSVGYLLAIYLRKPPAHTETFRPVEFEGCTFVGGYNISGIHATFKDCRFEPRPEE